MDEGGNASSPFMAAKGFGQWDITAKSAIETMPCRSITSGLCHGIFAITYEQFVTGNCKWEKKAVRCNLSNYRTEMALLEYSTDDIIMSSSEEIVLRQCNIIYTASSTEFKNKSHDGTLECLQRDFHAQKQLLPACTFAHPIARHSEEVASFLSLTKLREKHIPYILAITMLTYGNMVFLAIGKSNDRMLLWYSLIMSSLSESSTEKQIINYVMSIRWNFLSLLTDKQVGELVKALVFSKFKKGTADLEKEIYHDIWLIARKKVLSLDFKENQLLSVVCKALYSSL